MRYPDSTVFAGSVGAEGFDLEGDEAMAIRVCDDREYARVPLGEASSESDEVAFCA